MLPSQNLGGKELGSQLMELGLGLALGLGLGLGLELGGSFAGGIWLSVWLHCLASSLVLSFLDFLFVFGRLSFLLGWQPGTVCFADRGF